MIVLAGVAAAEAFRRLTAAVGRGACERFDCAVRRQFSGRHRAEADVASDVVTLLTAPAFAVPATLIAAFALRRRGAAAWLPAAAAPFVAMSFGAACSRTLAPRDAPAKREGESCFPSGHTTGLTAEAVTLAYILRREGLLHLPQAMALLAAPIGGGVNRLYRDRHWATDIAAGWSGGIAVACGCALLSELLRLA